jgi:trans-AT polyketide synthase/acyltransferase/oxidoreductase domain-containing protein/rhizoxin biosynthesis acyltransferase
MFPGQGSQKKGMGDRLFDELAEFKSVERDIDQLLGYSLRKLCLEDAENRLKDTRFTQPALFVVNALHYYSAVRAGDKPAFLIGHSLGEYNALLAAGVFDLLTGVRLVQKRGELMARATNGGMAAVIGLDPTAIANVLRDNRLTTIDVANFNSPTQTVVSGPVADIKTATPLFERAGARMCMPLQVSAAFHSRYMEGAAKDFTAHMQSFTFNKPAIPVISNVTAQPYPDDAATARSLLARQITSSVRWTDSIRYLLARGATVFKEVGPGNVLTGLLAQIRPKTAA